MIEYRYALVRYVPNPKRMEPTNVGVLLQGAGRLDFKLNPHAPKRANINTTVFHQWRDFLDKEVRGPHLPLFQPPREDSAFLAYLSDLCNSTVVLSTAYQFVTPLPFDLALEALYAELVAPPPDANPPVPNQPAGRFRQLTDVRGFVKRGMKRHEHVVRGGDRLWMAYRQVENGCLLAIDKVEVNERMGATANEIERLPTVESKLHSFLCPGKGEKPTRYVLLVDELSKPFGSQPPAEFEAMREDLNSAVESLTSKGAEIVRTLDSTVELADEIDAMLSPYP